MQMDQTDLDRFDRAILWHLAGDGRMSIATLAERIGLSKSPTQARVKRLERAGIIAGYRAQLDPIRMGLAHVAFVEVRLSDTREAALQAFNRAACALPEIEECHMIAGGFDYLLKVRTSDPVGVRTTSVTHVFRVIVRSQASPWGMTSFGNSFNLLSGEAKDVISPSVIRPVHPQRGGRSTGTVCG